MTERCDNLLVWLLCHYQVTTDAWGEEEYELPHLLIGVFARRALAEEVRERLRRKPGFCDWPLGFRLECNRPDDDDAWDTGFLREGDDEEPVVDRADVLRLPEPTPAGVPREIWKVWHFQVRDPSAPPDPWSAKGIGSFSTPANAAAAVAHRRRQPGFCDWPDGFRCYRHLLGVAFGLDGFQERYGWEAWAQSLRG